MNVVKRLFVAAGVMAVFVFAPTLAKATPPCCVGGACCLKGKCCTMPGCCKADKSCCDPAKGVCTSACGCPGMPCCDGSAKKTTAKKAVLKKLVRNSHYAKK